MKIAFADLWRSNGTIDRGPYVLVGLLGFALKHNLDRLIAYGFHRQWTFFNYWVPARDVSRITELRGTEAEFLGTMVAVSLPFIWVGVILTMKRLRSVQLPSWLVTFFFIPFLNLGFFLLLSLLPARDSYFETRAKRQEESFLNKVVPESALGSAAIAVLLTVPIGFGLALLALQVLGSYGWGLFVALPFALGFAAALIYGMRQPRSFRGCAVPRRTLRVDEAGQPRLSNGKLLQVTQINPGIVTAILTNGSQQVSDDRGGDQ